MEYQEFLFSLVDQETLSNLITSLVSLAILVVSYYAKNWMNKNTKSVELGDAQFIISEIVKMVEQTSSDVSGDTRKIKAIQYAKSVLSSNGIKLDDDLIESLIEAAVYQLKNPVDYEVKTQI